jgi:cytidine deaminase
MMPESLTAEEQLLLREARDAARRARATVAERTGAVALTADGERFPGAAQHFAAAAGLSACAERVAVWAARAAGAGEITCLALWMPAGAGAHPCGICLQVVRELAPGACLLVQRGDAPASRHEPDDLMPDAFEHFQAPGP